MLFRQEGCDYGNILSRTRRPWWELGQVYVECAPFEIFNLELESKAGVNFNETISRSWKHNNQNLRQGVLGAGVSHD